MQLQPGLWKLGKTWSSGQETATSPDAYSGQSTGGPPTGLEGTVASFNSVDVPENSGLQTLLSGREMHAIAVRNTHSAAVLPGQIVLWEGAYRGRRTDALADDADAAHLVAGVVDPFVKEGGVAVNDLYWLIVKGPVRCRSEAASYTVDDVVEVANTAGSLQDKTANNLLEYGDLGIALETKTTTSGDPYLLIDLYTY